MEKINISIKKAQIMSFSVSLDEGKPNVSTTIGLFTEGGKHITDHSISTQSWNDTNKFDLPVDLVPPIVEIMKKLELIATKHCRDSQLQLEGGDNE